MREKGLVGVPEPSSAFVQGRAEGMPGVIINSGTNAVINSGADADPLTWVEGSVIGAALKGSRSLLLEVQALTMPGRHKSLHKS